MLYSIHNTDYIYSTNIKTTEYLIINDIKNLIFINYEKSILNILKIEKI